MKLRFSENQERVERDKQEGARDVVGKWDERCTG